MKTARLSAILFAVIYAASGLATAGTFTARDGSAQTWSVTDAYALVWDGNPYVPFGVVFEPAYLSQAQNDENWKVDEEIVAAFALAGVKDVMIRSAKGITGSPPEALQKIVDLLEANGIRYAVNLYDPPYAPLSGYSIEPTMNRVAGIRDSGVISQSFPAAKTVAYALCDARTGEIVQTGRAVVENGEINVQVTVRNAEEHVLLFYPQQAFAKGAQEWSLSDIWSDYDRRRDRLLAHFAQIEFGKGLRFFCDPFSDEFGISPRMESVVPDSPAFRIEYAAWLSRKYANPRSLGSAWGILKHNVSSFEEAARFVPLWRAGRGAPGVTDDATGSVHAVNVMSSTIWEDFGQFRTESLRGYISSVADVLKRTIADVPVVYTATGLQPMFQPMQSVGCDGLAIPSVSPDGTDAAAGVTLSLAESSPRNVWLIARVGSGNESAFQKKEDLFSAINGARNMGAKGFYTASSGTGVKSADLLVWLAEYASLSAEDKLFASYRPKAVYYPHTLARGQVRRLSDGSWWLPSLKPGAEIFLGSFLAGYVLGDLKDPLAGIHVWSLEGKRTMTLVSDNPIIVTPLDGDPVEHQPKKGRIQIDVGEQIVRVNGLSADLFLPVEVLTEEIAELEKTITRAEQKRMDVTVYERNAKSAKDMLAKNQLGLCLDLVRTSIDELNRQLRGLENEPIPGAAATPPSQ